MARRRIKRIIVAVGLLGIVAGVVVLGSGSAPRQLGSNLVREHTFPVIVPGGAAACQTEPSVPDGTGRIRVLVGAYGRPGPALSVTVRKAGRPISSGGLARGWPSGHQEIAMAPVRGDRLGARLCIRNLGHERVALAGEPAVTGPAATVGNDVQGGQFRVEYLTGRPVTWWAFAGRLPSRVGVVHNAVPHGATLWVWLLLLVAVVGSVAALALSREDEDA